MHNLLDISVVNNLDSKIGEGGFEMEMGKDVYYCVNMKNKNNEILQIGLNWVEKNKMSIIKSLLNKDGMLLHFTSSKTKGYYELLYKFLKYDNNNILVKLHLVFFDIEGIEKLPEYVENINTEDIKRDLIKCLTQN